MNAQTTRIAVREALARLLVISAAASIAACSGD
jgi:hypothetical protein